MSRKFGWHSGTVTAQDGKFKGDLYVQDDIVFSDVSAGVLGVTGGIDMTGTTSAVGLDFNTGTFSTAEIRLGNAATIDNSTNGIVICTEPTWNFRATTGFIHSYDASNYLTSTVASNGVCKLATTGSADSFEIETSDGGITLDAANNITLDAGTGDVDFTTDALFATAEKCQFRDTGLYIHSSTDGQLDIVADTTVAISGALTADSTFVLTGDFTCNGGDITITETADTATGAEINLSQVSASPAANDNVGILNFLGKDDGGSDTETYAQITGTIDDPADGAEFGSIRFSVLNGTGSTLVACGRIYNDGSYGTIAAGSGAAAGVIKSVGDYDLIIETGNSTTGTITLTDGANGNITLATNGTGIFDVNSVLNVEDTITGGASNGNIIKKTLQAGEAYTGTTAGLMVKCYDADGTVTVPSGEFTGLYVNLKGLHTDPGNNTSLISAHVHASNTTTVHAGLWLYGDMTNGVKMSGSTLTSAIDISEATAVTHLFDLPAGGTAPVTAATGAVGNTTHKIAIDIGGTTRYLVVYDDIAAS